MEAASGFPSDTNILVDVCLARVREAARLDDDPVLPRLPPPLPRKERRHDVIIVTPDAIPQPAAIVKATAEARAKTTMRTSRARPAAIRWPLVLCAIVAAAAAIASFLASPVGKRPGVQHVTSAVVHRGARTFTATKAFFRGRL